MLYQARPSEKTARIIPLRHGACPRELGRQGCPLEVLAMIFPAGRWSGQAARLLGGVMVSISGTDDATAPRLAPTAALEAALSTDLFTGALRGAKAELDPAGIMTPGVLLPPPEAVSDSHEGGR
jgi:hypothetical protein